MRKRLTELWSVTSFSFTQELLAGKMTPTQLLSYTAGQSVSENFELDGPQFFRNYPNVSQEDIDAVLATCKDTGSRIRMIGGYMDRSHGAKYPVDQELVMQRLHRQLELASLLGAKRLRLQFDALRESELDQAIQWAEKFDVRILLELQGSATPDQPQVSKIIGWVTKRNHPMLRILIDASLFMRAFPSTFKHRLSTLGLTHELIDSIETKWFESPLGEFRSWLLEQVEQEALPRSIMSQMPTLTSRFGHSRASDWKSLSPVLDSLHLKYWDADDSAGALSEVARQALSLFDTDDFPGFIVSEWGGHDWIPLEVASGLEMSFRHRAAVEPVLTHYAKPDQTAVEGARVA